MSWQARGLRLGIRLFRTGRRVFSLDYRLAPEHRFPAALDDALAGYRWLLGQGIAPGQVALAGDSAGGGLVLATLLRVRDESLPLPGCGVCFSPWTDLTASGESITLNNGQCVMFRPATISDFARVYLGSAPATHPYASPLFGRLAGLPPLLFQVCGDELLLDDTRRVCGSIQRAGGPVRLEVTDGVFHVWQMLDGFLPEAGAALDRAAAFIRENGKTTGPAVRPGPYVRPASGARG